MGAWLGWGDVDVFFVEATGVASVICYAAAVCGCVYALAAVLPLLPAKQRQLPAFDWLEQDSLVACPDPEERLVMRITRTSSRSMRSSDLT